MAEILASLDDINANLPSEETDSVIVANDENTALLQISVARVVRGYLSRVIDNSILLGWNTPIKTPEMVKEAASKLIAAQLFFNQTAKTTTNIDPDSFSQKRYDEAMDILKQIITGDIILVDVETDATGNMTVDDFWPVDATDRAFTMGQQF